MSDTQIQHDPSSHKFLLSAGLDQAVLEYRLLLPPSSDGVTVVDFTHTFVPPAARGRGVAEKLVRHGLRWAKNQGYDIRASCWYVDKFLR